MKTDGHSYIAIALKSFYSSVECVERGLDPLSPQTSWWPTKAARRKRYASLPLAPNLNRVH